VIGEAGTASAALASIPGLRPDVALLDARLPDGNGVSVCRDIRSRAPGVACLIFTAFSDDQALLDPILAGAAGYVLKQVRGSDLAVAVRTAASGQSLLNPRAASKLIARRRDASGKHDPLARLTPHERSVLELIGEGLTNRQIGERLFDAGLAARAVPVLADRPGWAVLVEPGDREILALPERCGRARATVPGAGDGPRPRALVRLPLGVVLVKVPLDGLAGDCEGAGDLVDGIAALPVAAGLGVHAPGHLGPPGKEPGLAAADRPRARAEAR
jgi:DNA-binding NarL/FixJ family response regulator